MLELRQTLDAADADMQMYVTLEIRAFRGHVTWFKRPACIRYHFQGKASRRSEDLMSLSAHPPRCENRLCTRVLESSTPMTALPACVAFCLSVLTELGECSVDDGVVASALFHFQLTIILPPPSSGAGCGCGRSHATNLRHFPPSSHHTPAGRETTCC